MRSHSAALALIVILVLAGCGGGEQHLSKPEYEAEVLRIARELEPPATRLFFDVVANDYPRATCAAKKERFHGMLSEIVDRVEALDPPDEVAGLQRRFLAAAQGSVHAVGEAANDARAGRLSCGMPLNRRIYGLPSTRRAEAVLAEFQQRGYFPWYGGD
jgi:hypothetical protein